MTREDSDRDLATQLDTQVPESDATPSLDGWTGQLRTLVNRFVPWASGTPNTPHKGVVAHVQRLKHGMHGLDFSDQQRT